MAVVYGVLGLIVILTAGTFGTINASPWFNLGIAVAVRRPRARDVRRDRRSTSRDSRSGFQVGEARPRHRSCWRSAWARSPRCSPARAWRRSSSRSCCSPATCTRPGTSDRARAAVLPGRRHGAAVADRRRRHRGAAEAGHVDGARQAGVRRVHPRDGGLLRLSRVRAASRIAGSIRPRSRRSVEEKLKEGWYASLDEGLAAAEREQKPVLIDFWATWCKNCLAMDKTTLADPAVGAALAGYIKIKFQAEVPTSRRRRRHAALRRHRPAHLRHPETAMNGVRPERYVVRVSASAATARASAAGCTGLLKCIWNPAASARSRSSSRAWAVTAAAGIIAS